MNVAAVDDDALAVLVRDHHDRVYRFGRAVCRSSADVDDAVQDAFVRLAARRDVIEGGSALGWLLRVVKHNCFRLMRRFTRSLGVSFDADDSALDDVAAADLTPEQALLRFELVRRVHAAIAALTPEQRAVIVLRDLEGQSAHDVALALGVGEEAVKSRLARARAAVRTQLER